MEKYSTDKLNRVKRGSNRALYDVEVINEILDAGFIGHVSYVYNDYPICIPMAYGRKDDKIYLHGSTANRMLLTLLENKKASMTVMFLDGLVLARSGFHHSVNYRSATLFGKVKKIEKDEEKTKVLEIITNNMVADRWDTLRKMTQEELNRTLVVEFNIETASAKVRAEGVNDEPEDLNENVWAGIIPIRQIAEQPIADKGLPLKMEIPKHINEYYGQNKL